MIATKLKHLSSSGRNPKEWESLPGIKESRPKGNGYVEVSLQRLDTHKSTILVQWHGAKNGVWYPEGDIFIIKNK